MLKLFRVGMGILLFAISSVSWAGSLERIFRERFAADAEIVKQQTRLRNAGYRGQPIESAIVAMESLPQDREVITALVTQLFLPPDNSLKFQPVVVSGYVVTDSQGDDSKVPSRQDVLALDCNSFLNVVPSLRAAAGEGF